jgi:hypothetical protein
MIGDYHMLAASTETPNYGEGAALVPVKDQGLMRHAVREAPALLS